MFQIPKKVKLSLCAVKTINERCASCASLLPDF